MTYQTDDLRITAIQELASPEQIQQDIPITDNAAKTVHDARQAIYRILDGEDDRLLVVVGPCSIHDPDAALDYAKRLQTLAAELSDDLFIVMRVYFEKPRTTVGWKGLINDPDLDDSFHINKGVHLARNLLMQLSDMGIPAGTEYLDLISPQYISDLVSWGAIGARTTESQGHRELASGLSCPVGFKNGTDGRLQIAIDAMRSSSRPHSFLSVTKQGHSAIFSTSGNPYTHIILRGGSRPNYDRESVNEAANQLRDSGLRDRVMVDCSHANSQKKFHKQIEVCEDIAHQLKTGQQSIFGVMIESHLVEGRQDIQPGRELVYGQSITDACLGFDDSEKLLHVLAGAVQQARKNA
ncbi:MAG: 3-deoxy-7-phosphoheptulonate synthase [Gammaproteobacteria bacterium]|nr:3-deoxy-7-phosphoheptulonate synthase [Gammaproteobacteria bacterium]